MDANSICYYDLTPIVSRELDGAKQAGRQLHPEKGWGKVTSLRTI